MRISAVAITAVILAACGSAEPQARVENFLGTAGKCLINLEFEEALAEGRLRGNIEMWRPGVQRQSSRFTGTRRGRAVRLTVSETLPERGVWEGQMVGHVLVLNVRPTPEEFHDFVPPCPGGSVVFAEVDGTQFDRERIAKLFAPE